MNLKGRRWTIQDRFGNPIYLTEERWRHIAGPENHPELNDYEDYVQATIRHSQRRQEPLNPRKYRTMAETTPPTFSYDDDADIL